MEAFGISTVSTYLYSYASMMHVIRTELVATVGKLVSSLDIKYLWLLPPGTVMIFRVPYLFSLKKRWEYIIVFLCYLIKSFLCRGTNVYLICTCFIYEWTAPLPFLTYFLNPSLSDIWVMMNAVTSGSFWTAPWLKNTQSSGFSTSCSIIYAAVYT